MVIPCISSQERELRYKPHLDITLSPSAVISMVTVYPGDEIYSLFGHSSFRVYDPENRIDWMYNYGTFDFDDPAFVPKFVSGKLEYYLDINSYQSAFKFYKNVEKRKIVEQMLDLDPKEKQKLFDFLQDNGEMEDRFYKYDFIWDNCSTRIADALDKALPGLADYSAYKSTGESFRTMIRQYLASRPFTDFGIQLALGSGADAVPQGNEVFFLPLPMMEAFSSAVIGSKGGVPLVYEELVPGESDRVYTKRGDYPLIIFTSLLVLYAVLLLLLYRRRSSVVPEGGARGPHLTGTAHTVRATHIVRPARIAIRIIESSVFLLTGIAGIIISYLWFFSDHTITAANFNLLWCTPLNLILLFTWPEKDNPPAGRKAVLLMQIVSLALFALCAISLLCALLRAQAFLPAFLPLILIIMTAEWRRALGWIKVKK
ncbi:MAG: DUF4105 domain-containing protein [Spirochaetia bacterium]|nr:DUF4105 domain-containing protein [Spirochaetia bacterium]